MGQDEVMEKLLKGVRIKDLPEENQRVADVIGLENFIALCRYANGERLYFPKLENVVYGERNRAIKREFNGRNYDELAKKYNLTTRQIRNILKDEPIFGQIELEFL